MMTKWNKWTIVQEKITQRVNPNPKNESPNRIKVLQHETC